ncbi:hypothetical protein CHL76_02220 [Marinococcus halophilus]|uniref:Uncharacterized protein n=1 Tax=Marinococcus halophilus TaxID=1371 RepID=A0A510Y1C7_MARHA|nr:hypothetical protein [Marinococcus halophilus]OZT81192.1 hypothetical protein CHL76_02220 [Marinococcus halophilus]GEK57125.1 hypothetical protein MHA01_00300 [Marinococcus halophilus]
MEEIQKAIGTTKEVELGNGEIVEVKKLPLGNYAKLLMTLKNMPTDILKDLQGMEGNSDEGAIQLIFEVFGKSWEQIIEVIAIGSGITKKRLNEDNNIGLDGGIALFLAIYEVNNLEQVIGQVKNVMNRPKE